MIDQTENEESYNSSARSEVGPALEEAPEARGRSNAVLRADPEKATPMRAVWRFVQRYGHLLPLLAVAIVTIANCVLLAPELMIDRISVNDNIAHLTIVERVATALQHGENPLDSWMPEWQLGYPVLRTYQPLAHLLVVGVWLAIGKAASLQGVFIWFRYLAVALLPLSFWAAARLLGMRPWTAATAAVLGPMISSNRLYGVEYGSFTWTGWGLFPQSVATHFMLLSIGLGYRAIRCGKNLTLAGVALGLTFLSHFIYGYMGAVSLCLLAVMPDKETGWMLRWHRTGWVAVTSAALSAFQLAPLAIDQTINRSRGEAIWKWDSFGPDVVMKTLFRGELLDFGRLPALTLLAFCGVGWLLWRRYKLRETDRWAAFTLVAAAFWIAMFCGRPLWGPLLTILGVSPDMQLHRVIAGAQVFLLLLAAAGLTALIGGLWRRRWYVLATAALVALMYPMAQDRLLFLERNARRGSQTLRLHDSVRVPVAATLGQVKQRGGRVYAGLRGNWGRKIRIGGVTFSAELSTAQIPAVSILYNSLALTADIMVRFDQTKPEQYRLFNIQTVVTPVENPPTLPAFLVPIERIDKFRTLSAPGGGYFDLVDTAAAVTTSRNDFFDVNDRWLKSPWVAMHKHLLLDWNGDAPPSLMRVAPGEALPAVAPGDALGSVGAEQQHGEIYQADFYASRDCYVLFKMTWHANWRAELDGKPVRTVMLSPGFPGVAVAAGSHRIRFQYTPEWWRAAGPFIGLLLVILLFSAERAGLAVTLWHAVDSIRFSMDTRTRRRLLTAAGIVALALPVCVPLFSSHLLTGHDAWVSFQRLTEYHQNISHGILFPRWAPDLSSGNGQPFLFTQPMIYYAAEIWHLLGFKLVTSMNLACAAAVLASAFAMFLLGQLYFGAKGGWLASAALLYAPYFAVDLYIRSATEELAAFPFALLALYGFGAYAKSNKRVFLAVGTAGFAGVIYSHNASALLFSPLLVGFLIYTACRARSWKIMFNQAAGFLLGLGLATAVWLPDLAERQNIQLGNLLRGSLRYSNHFIRLPQLLYSPWSSGSAISPKDGMSFGLGLGHLLVLIALLVLVWRSPKSVDRSWVLFFAALCSVFCFLTLRNAMWIWDRLPLLQYIQFPWRCLGSSSICLALLIAALGKALDSWPRWRSAAFVVAMVLLIVPNLSHMASSRGLSDVDPALWSPQMIAARDVSATAAGVFTTRWQSVRAPYTPVVAAVVNGDTQLQQAGRLPTYWSAQLSAREPSAIRLAISYFPGWEVRIDGTPAAVRPAPKTGQILFDVPAGRHRVEAQFVRTAIMRLADWIRFLSLVLLALISTDWSAYRKRLLHRYVPARSQAPVQV